MCIVRHQHSSVKCFENTLVDGVLGPISLGRLGQFPQFSSVLALDKAGSDFPQPGNSVSKVSVFLVGQGTKESPEKAVSFQNLEYIICLYTL